mgnify:CR=1 FL=1
MEPANAQQTTNQAIQQSNGAQPADGQKPAAAESEEQKQSNGKGWEAAKAHKERAEQLAKELETVKANQAKRDQDDAASRGEYQKLWTEEKNKREAIEQENARLVKRHALSTELQKLGIIDPDDINLIDLSELEIDGGKVKNVSAVAKSFLASKPHKFGKPGKTGQPFETPSATPGRANPTPAEIGSIRIEDVHRMTPEQRKAYLSQVRNAGRS